MGLAARLETLGIGLPALPAPIGAFLPAKQHGDLLFVSGQLPLVDGSPLAIGRVGTGPDDVDAELARLCARQCAINGLAAAVASVGSLDGLAGVVRVGGFVVSAPQFFGQPAVVDGASGLLIELFGDEGRHARAAVGVAALPLDCPVEVEFTFALR